MLHRLDDQLTCRQSRSLDGQLACLHERDIQEILNQTVHARGGAVDRLPRLPRSPFGLRAASLQCRCLHQDRGQRIAQVVSHDAEHLITELGGLDRRAVEPCILDGHRRSLGQRFGHTKIVRSVNARRSRGAKRQRADGLSSYQERHYDERCEVSRQERLQVFRPLRN